jgi:predicted translin family RNA/ssDNA-binding protein
MCLEELVEALTFGHYLKTQTLISHAELSPIVEDLARKGVVPQDDQVMGDAGDTAGTTAEAAEAPTTEGVPVISLTEDDYLYGVFDLTGEMMRFATTSTALSGSMASGQGSGSEDHEPRTIVQDMHELGTFFEMLPVGRESRFQWYKKLEVTRQSVQKVEKLGYDRIVRGTERPKGWIPDLSAGDQGQGDELE